MSKGQYVNSEDRVERKLRSKLNHTEGQNNSLLEIVERLRTAHHALAEAYEPFTSMEGNIGTIASFVVQKQRNLVSELDIILNDPDEYHAKGFIQYDHPNHPESVADAFELTAEHSNEDLQSAILNARQSLIHWNNGLSQEDMPDKMRAFLKDLLNLQEREKHKLAESFDSHNKS